MTRTSKFVLQLATLSLLTIAVAASADPLNLGRGPARPQRAPRVPVPSFAATGVYGGYVGDQVNIDGATYTLRQKTQPYLIGRGLISMSEIPIGSRVYATVVGSETSGVIWGLIVRPADEERQPRDMTGQARLRPESAPR